LYYRNRIHPVKQSFARRSCQRLNSVSRGRILDGKGWKAMSETLSALGGIGLFLLGMKIMTEALREANFTATAWGDALHFPPSERRFVLRLHQLLEQAGRRFWPIFAGVLVVEAEKRLYQGLPVTARASRRVFVPVLSPQGATRVGALRRNQEREC